MFLDDLLDIKAQIFAKTAKYGETTVHMSTESVRKLAGLNDTKSQIIVVVVAI